jgi:transposase
MDTYAVEQASIAKGDRKPVRRMRSVAEKTRIVEETFEAGVSVAEVARRHGVNANLLFSWRRQYTQGVLAPRTRPAKAAKLLPVKVIEAAPDPAPTPALPGTIEIEWPDKVRVCVTGGVTTAQLSTVLRALGQCR